MSGPDRFPEAGSRAVVYVIYDRRGRIDDFVLYALSRLREHADRIVAVVNGELLEESRARLEAVADDVLERENTGMDIWGQKAGLDLLGDEIARYDEVVLTNDTWFGPVRPFAPVFASMDAAEIDFWVSRITAASSRARLGRARSSRTIFNPSGSRPSTHVHL